MLNFQELYKIIETHYLSHYRVRDMILQIFYSLQFFLITAMRTANSEQ